MSNRALEDHLITKKLSQGELLDLAIGVIGLLPDLDSHYHGVKNTVSIHRNDGSELTYRHEGENKIAFYTQDIEALLVPVRT